MATIVKKWKVGDVDERGRTVKGILDGVPLWTKPDAALAAAPKVAPEAAPKVAPKARPRKAKRAGKLNECLCGCGGKCRNLFERGHVSRLFKISLNDPRVMTEALKAARQRIDKRAKKRADWIRSVVKLARKRKP